MPRHLLPALCLLLLLLGCACGPAWAWDDGSADSVQLRVSRETAVPQKVGDEDPKRVVDSFASPFLVSGNGVVVAFAEAQYTVRGKKNTGIVARYIETEGPNWAVRAIENNGTNWKTQLVLKKSAVNHSALRSPTAVIQDDKIYLLALSNRTKDSSQSGNGWHFELVVGEIKGEVGSKKIGWGSSVSLSSKLTEMVKKNGWKVFPGYNNSAYITSNGRNVFSVNAKNTENTSGFALMTLYAEYELWEVSFVENPEECRVFSVLEWKEKLISVFSGCATNNTHVKEYDIVREEWKKVDDASFCVWNLFKTSRDFIPVTIGNKNVLLFTEEGYLKRFAGGGKSAIRLGFTDGSRVHDAHILTQSSNVTSGGLLYTNDELFFMYQDAENGLGAIVFRRLDDELRGIKSKLNSWTESDAYLSKPCNETVPEGASSDTLCVTPMPTDGLVGFLSNRDDANHWYDEYNFKNAEVKGGRKVKNGFTFSKAHDGAWWSVGQIYPSNRYNFMKYGLTVVATVTIHKVPEGDAPLLTVEGNGLSERLGLWYKGGQWKLISRIGEKEPAVGLATNMTYKVALAVQNNAISVYVNGNSLGNPQSLSAPGKRPFDIASVQIGAYKLINGIHMTVTNVLLYNRVLSDTELKTTSKTFATALLTDSEKTPEPVPEPTNKAEAVPESPNKTKAVPEPTNKAEAVPESPNKTKAVPEPTNKAEAAPEPTNKAETVPEPTKTTETVPEPEDGSVCVRISFTSLFLLGCFCLAIF